MAEAKAAGHVVILPSPGMGHLIPAAELAKRLILRHGLAVTVVIPGEGPPTKSQRAVVESLSPSINTVLLPPPDFSDHPPVFTRLLLTVIRSNSALRQLFRSFEVEGPLPVALVVDPFGADAFDVAAEFHVAPYLFFTSSANALAFALYLPELDETVSCEYRDLTEPVHLPGCVPVPGKDLLQPVQDRKRDTYKWFLHNAKRYREAHGILVNSFQELEPRAIKALQEPATGRPPIYPVGPLVNIGSSDANRTEKSESECLQWLDKQPPRSVLYVSFGSGGTLTQDQLNELALGLEDSHQRFLWVVRTPSGIANSAILDSHSQGDDDPLTFLPHGFMGRTQNRGLVIPSWAPQAQIMAHPSTGGFLTHCGWNSILESIVNGVPLIAWPLYGEQRMNALLLVEEIRAALRPPSFSDGVIGREEISDVAKRLMEGEEVRNRMNELKEAASMAFSGDGSSTRTLDDLVSFRWVKS
ncbi:PREDICTED: UDP-glycosyltransferase 72B1-like [Tarenaya hassleriana]|uniref:UDP-glycosyltransferase 72B1-like n=1 Tax=Tarenaya hassleriana TaxID=28532 RepID=UPI00053C2F40|nr:PREDICTED: UDP-glycosyltransferase 72B1-like [Tarenaya hassleriana]